MRTQLFPTFQPTLSAFLNENAALTDVKVNIEEQQHAYVLKFLAAGYQKEHFSIHIEQNILEVSAKKEHDNTAEGTMIQKEFGLGTFKKRFKLPKQIQTETVSAQYESGILTVTVLKTADKTPERISVTVA